MSFYPPKINERFENARSSGELPDASATGTSANFACGTFVKFYLRIEIDSKTIAEARYKTGGCGFTIAAAEFLCGEIVGRKLVELHGSDKSVLRGKIENALGEFPEPRAHCLETCLESLQAAFADFRVSQIVERSGEKALICTCFGVSAATIENLTNENALQTIEEVTSACGAGGGCGACQPLILEIIDAANDFPDEVLA